MEARIARIESDVAHLRTDVAERSRPTSARCASGWTQRMDRLESKFDTKFESLETKFDRKFSWALSLGIASVAGILGAMARGFGWL